MTRIAVIAADGRSGREFVKRALAAGHEVRAGIYKGSTFPDHERLTLVPCDATRVDEVRTLIDSSDAVVSMIGHGPKSPRRVQTDAMKVVVEVMHELGATRLVSLTGTGVRFPGDKPNLLDRMANLFISTVDPNRVQDGIEHARYLESTDLRWTILRVLKLGNGEHEGRVRFSLTGPAESLTPRTRAAQAALQVIEDDSFICQAPIITGVDSSTV